MQFQKEKRKPSPPPNYQPLYETLEKRKKVFREYHADTWHITLLHPQAQDPFPSLPSSLLPLVMYNTPSWKLEPILSIFAPPANNHLKKEKKLLPTQQIKKTIGMTRITKNISHKRILANQVPIRFPQTLSQMAFHVLPDLVVSD